MTMSSASKRRRQPDTRQLCAPFAPRLRKIRGCVPAKKAPSKNSVDTIADVVDDYIVRFRGPARDELRWFADQPSLKAAIHMAGTATGEHGKLVHQWRRPRALLRAFANRLTGRIDAIRNARSFDALYDIVESAALKGIAALTIYDTALRIGAFLNVEPEDVYLHAGTKVGARALGFHRRETLSERELPNAFRRLTPSEIEDCLCIYKDDLTATAASNKRLA